MKRILKYDIPGACNNYGVFEIESRRNGRAVFVGLQGMDRRVWIEVDDEKEPVEMLHFYLVGTGYQFPENCRYVGTFMEARFVWHLYQIEKTS
jgi:hypothetical protein